MTRDRNRKFGWIPLKCIYHYLLERSMTHCWLGIGLEINIYDLVVWLLLSIALQFALFFRQISAVTSDLQTKLEFYRHQAKTPDRTLTSVSQPQPVVTPFLHSRTWSLIVNPVRKMMIRWNHFSWPHLPVSLDPTLSQLKLPSRYQPGQGKWSCSTVPSCSSKEER